MIVFQDVSYAYEAGKSVLDGVRLELPAGLVLLLGPNGCGKSTLLKLASGVEKPDAGAVLVDGKDLWKDEREARLRIAYLPEHPDLTPYATLGEVVCLVCRMLNRFRASNGDPGTDRGKAQCHAKPQMCGRRKSLGQAVPAKKQQDRHRSNQWNEIGQKYRSRCDE